jgi:hypothetical protein
VEFTDEPTERFYGTDCGPRDPFGNNIRIGHAVSSSTSTTAKPSKPGLSE